MLWIIELAAALAIAILGYRLYARAISAAFTAGQKSIRVRVVVGITPLIDVDGAEVNAMAEKEGQPVGWTYGSVAVNISTNGE